MYADREHHSSGSRPAVDASSRLFHQIRQNQEDRKLYEEASVDLYQSTPDSEPAKRHGMLKPTINGKTPKHWMSMRSSGRLDTAASAHLQTPRLQTVLQQPSLLSSAPAAMVQASMRTPAGQQQQSGRLDMVPHSEGLFGRQRAAKRQHSHIAITSEDSTPVASPPVIGNGFSKDRLQPRHQHSAKQSSEPVLNRGMNIEPAQTPSSTFARRGFDALDRLNARKGYGPPATLPSSHSPLQPANHSKPVKANPVSMTADASAVTAQAAVPVQSHASAQSLPRQLPQEASRPIDALDRFNKRHKSQGKMHDGIAHGLVSAEYQLGQSRCTAEAQAQRPLDALARFNMRKGHRPFGTSVPVTKPDVQETDAEIPAKEDTAAESQQSQTTSVELEQVLPIQNRPTLAKESSESSQTPDALDKLNSVLLQRRQQRLGKQVHSVPAHVRKRMRAFDDDVGPDDIAHPSLQVQSEPRTNTYQHRELAGLSAANLSSVSNRLSARLGKMSGV